MKRQQGSAAGSPRGSPKNVLGGHTGSMAKSVRLLGPVYMAPALRVVAPVRQHSPVRAIPPRRTGMATGSIQPGKVGQARCSRLSSAVRAFILSSAARSSLLVIAGFSFYLGNVFPAAMDYLRCAAGSDNTAPPTQPATKDYGLSFSMADVCKTFKRVNPRKAADPDGIPSHGLRACADQLVKTKELIVNFRKQQRKHPYIHIDRTALEKVEIFNKTKELIVNFRKQQRKPPHIHIDGTTVEKVEIFKFLVLIEVIVGISAVFGGIMALNMDVLLPGPYLSVIFFWILVACFPSAIASHVVAEYPNKCREFLKDMYSGQVDMLIAISSVTSPLLFSASGFLSCSVLSFIDISLNEVPRAKQSYDILLLILMVLLLVQAVLTLATVVHCASYKSQLRMGALEWDDSQQLPALHLELALSATSIQRNTGDFDKDKAWKAVVIVAH
ncbi:membrane protein MLC1-like [Oncorhynchus masou masou]|uniref:membrane protein MLC1-like n=1 Tax=Oncorhynchus masou masou TaxID=90313 RepID=UPI0031843A60